MTLAGTRVLVTGAGGFIGSHLVEKLLRLGARVRAFVHYNALGTNGWLAELDEEETGSIDLHAGDIADYHSVLQAVEGCEFVFHLAALIGIPYSYKSPFSYLRTNVEGTLNVLEACRCSSVRRLVHTSSSEVYGSADYVPIDEKHPLHGQSPYSASKIAADKLAESYHCSFDLPVVIARPFNTFGPRQSTRAIIPTILTQLLTGAAEIQLGSLSPTRDMNPVANTVDGLIACALASDDAEGQVFNLGSGREISIGELANLLIRMTGKSARVVSDPERQRPPRSEVHRLLCDSSRAQRVLGWEPARSLEQGLEEVIPWMNDHLTSYKPSLYQV